MSDDLNLDVPFREAILTNSAITDLLGIWNGEPAVFTRRPVPEDAPYPFILVGEDVAYGNRDMLVQQIPVVRRDLFAYGQNGPTPDVSDYRTVEQLGYLLRRQFHRKRLSVTVPDFNVIDIVAAGPIPAPVDDEKLVGRAVPLTIRLQDLAT